MSQIPKIIFQTWKTRKKLPRLYEIWRKTIIDNNPSYRYILWNDQDNRKFIKKFYPWFLNFYDSYEKEIMRADAVRYFFLYHFGGIYIDLDTECLCALDEFLNKGDVVLGWMGENSNFPHSIPNAIMMSSPRQEFWLIVLYLLLYQARKNLVPEHKTGPILLKQAVGIYTDHGRREAFLQEVHKVLLQLQIQIPPRHESKIHIAPPHSFYPVNWNDPIHQYFIRRRVVRDGVLFTDEEKKALFPESTLVSYWTHSWEIEDWKD